MVDHDALRTRVVPVDQGIGDGFVDGDRREVRQGDLLAARERDVRNLRVERCPYRIERVRQQQNERFA